MSVERPQFQEISPANLPVASLTEEQITRVQQFVKEHALLQGLDVNCGKLDLQGKHTQRQEGSPLKAFINATGQIALTIDSSSALVDFLFDELSQGDGFEKALARVSCFARVKENKAPILKAITLKKMTQTQEKFVVEALPYLTSPEDLIKDEDLVRYVHTLPVSTLSPHAYRFCSAVVKQTKDKTLAKKLANVTLTPQSDWRFKHFVTEDRAFIRQKLDFSKTSHLLFYAKLFPQDLAKDTHFWHAFLTKDDEALLEAMQKAGIAIPYLGDTMVESYPRNLAKQLMKEWSELPLKALNRACTRQIDFVNDYFSLKVDVQRLFTQAVEDKQEHVIRWVIQNRNNQLDDRVLFFLIGTLTPDQLCSVCQGAPQFLSALMGQKNEKGDNVLHLFVRHVFHKAEKCNKLFDLLRNANPDHFKKAMCEKNNYGTTPLHQVVDALGHHAISWLDDGDVALQDVDGNTPLHILCKSPFLRRINCRQQQSLDKILQKLPPHVCGLPNIQGKTIEQVAMDQGNLKVVTSLQQLSKIWDSAHWIAEYEKTQDYKMQFYGLEHLYAIDSPGASKAWETFLKKSLQEKSGLDLKEFIEDLAKKRRLESLPKHLVQECKTRLDSLSLSEDAACQWAIASSKDGRGNLDKKAIQELFKNHSRYLKNSDLFCQQVLYGNDPALVGQYQTILKDPWVNLVKIKKYPEQCVQPLLTHFDSPQTYGDRILNLRTALDKHSEVTASTVLTLLYQNAIFKKEERYKLIKHLLENGEEHPKGEDFVFMFLKYYGVDWIAQDPSVLRKFPPSLVERIFKDEELKTNFLNLTCENLPILDLAIVVSSPYFVIELWEENNVSCLDREALVSLMFRYMKQTDLFLLQTCKKIDDQITQHFPLEKALLDKKDPDKLKFLIQQYPDSVKKFFENGVGSFVHDLLSSKQASSGIGELASRLGEALAPLLFCKNQEGKRPIDLLIEKQPGQTLQVIQNLMEAKILSDDQQASLLNLLEPIEAVKLLKGRYRSSSLETALVTQWRQTLIGRVDSLKQIGDKYVELGLIEKPPLLESWKNKMDGATSYQAMEKLIEQYTTELQKGALFSGENSWFSLKKEHFVAIQETSVPKAEVSIDWTKLLHKFDELSSKKMPKPQETIQGKTRAQLREGLAELIRVVQSRQDDVAIDSSKKKNFYEKLVNLYRNLQKRIDEGQDDDAVWSMLSDIARNSPAFGLCAAGWMREARYHWSLWNESIEDQTAQTWVQKQAFLFRRGLMTKIIERENSYTNGGQGIGYEVHTGKQFYYLIGEVRGVFDPQLPPVRDELGRVYVNKSSWFGGSEDHEKKKVLGMFDELYTPATVAEYFLSLLNSPTLKNNREVIMEALGEFGYQKFEEVTYQQARKEVEQYNLQYFKDCLNNKKALRDKVGQLQNQLQDKATFNTDDMVTCLQNNQSPLDILVNGVNAHQKGAFSAALVDEEYQFTTDAALVLMKIGGII